MRSATAGPSGKLQQVLRAGRSFDWVERSAFVLCLAAGMVSIFGAGASREADEPAGKQRALEVVFAPEETLPAGFDPAREIRVPLKEATGKAIVVVARGPWVFGKATQERVALDLGAPEARGPAFLQYGFAPEHVRLTALFNAGCLDTVILAPDPAQGLSRGWRLPSPTAAYQMVGGGERKAILRDKMRGVHYLVPLGDGGEAVDEVEEVLVLRFPAEVVNPVWVRGLTPLSAAPVPAENQIPGERRLLEQLQRSLRIKETVLGAEHVWTQYARFELGRTLLQVGRRGEGRQEILGAAGSLERLLGPRHPDVAAMRDWAEQGGGNLRARAPSR